MILKCLEGMYVTNTSEIFSDPRRKKKVFVEQYLGLFLAELGLFCHFVPGLLAIALGSSMDRRHHQKYKQYKQSSINRSGLNVLC